MSAMEHFAGYHNDNKVGVASDFLARECLMNNDKYKVVVDADYLEALIDACSIAHRELRERYTTNQSEALRSLEFLRTESSYLLKKIFKRDE